MGKCKIINSKRTKVCYGSLDIPIKIHNRTITAPDDNSVDFGLTFTEVIEVLANIQTIANKTEFDGTNTERVVSDVFYIRYIDGVTAESWIEVYNEYYDIVNTDNIGKRNEWLELRCNKRGTTSKPVNFA